MRKNLINRWIHRWAGAIIRSEADFITTPAKGEAAAQAHAYATVFHDLAAEFNLDYKQTFYLPMMRCVDAHRERYEQQLRDEFDHAMREMERLANQTTH